MRDDDRQTTDLERFYRPLVEVFEHSRLLLGVYRMLFMRRDRFDVDFTELTVQNGAPVICDSITGTVTAASWTRRQAGCRPHSTTSTVDEHANNGGKVTSAVALKLLMRRLDTRNVEDYLLEEEAYRLKLHTYNSYSVLMASRHPQTRAGSVKRMYTLYDEATTFQPDFQPCRLSMIYVGDNLK